MFMSVILMHCTQFECGGMVLEEAPGKVCEAFRLFLQGMGHGMYCIIVTSVLCTVSYQKYWGIIAYF